MAHTHTNTRARTMRQREYSADRRPRSPLREKRHLSAFVLHSFASLPRCRCCCRSCSLFSWNCHNGKAYPSHGWPQRCCDVGVDGDGGIGDERISQAHRSCDWPSCTRNTRARAKEREHNASKSANHARSNDRQDTWCRSWLWPRSSSTDIPRCECRLSCRRYEQHATCNLQQHQHDLMRCHRQYGVETVKKQLSPFGVEALSMGSPPWSYEEDLKLAPSVRALSHQHLSHHRSLTHNLRHLVRR